ncbi:hypothetical protein WALSEDRAFT_58065 [Wallemia mellicola CBS 633.66]|uniref:Velvet domain-containing protein n=1 Tax=Wallemia mellicola (strain ATCC MYA-4683 / CBS 633.66) TaxID=671144 RepID=I4Y9B4_WALMC|nr:hypothetical protein WALSEDRAFT_58065 [Wallemia mellicola CBS 633.66]EIM20556.1 hypothetical protein WALSEDRAFT_58065 [Wallemia mellicola CBS 633.66]|eukprot:XP_006959350.1 hypothetical protein WALSEDRAFT_58065 [Wallemia mellicola CBS 633.66]
MSQYFDYDLSMRQQPKHSRMCGVGSKADRRPIDPPPIVQLKVYSNHQNFKSRQDLSFNHFQSPYFFVYCSLAGEDSDEELHILSETKTRYTTGNVTSSIYCLRDLDLTEVLVAVFPDVSVRVEGRFRLKFSLFEIQNKTYHRKSLFSDPFTVFSAKRFPGMDQSTELSQCLANQGLKIRIRRDNRRDRRKSSKRYFDDEEEAGTSTNLNVPSIIPQQAQQLHNHTQPASNFKRPLAPLPSRITNIPDQPHEFSQSTLTRPLQSFPFESSSFRNLQTPSIVIPPYQSQRIHSSPVIYTRSDTSANDREVPPARPTLPSRQSFTQPTSVAATMSISPPSPQDSAPRIQLPPIRDLIQPPSTFNPSNFKPPNQR